MVTFYIPFYAKNVSATTTEDDGLFSVTIIILINIISRYWNITSVAMTASITNIFDEGSRNIFERSIMLRGSITIVNCNSIVILCTFCFVKRNCSTRLNIQRILGWIKLRDIADTELRTQAGNKYTLIV